MRDETLFRASKRGRAMLAATVVKRKRQSNLVYKVTPGFLARMSLNRFEEDRALGRGDEWTLVLQRSERPARPDLALPDNEEKDQITIRVASDRSSAVLESLNYPWRAYLTLTLVEKTIQQPDRDMMVETYVYSLDPHKEAPTVTYHTLRKWNQHGFYLELADHTSSESSAR